MTCSECRSTFTGLDEAAASVGETRAAALDRLQPGCRCQIYSVSDLSTGIVRDDEVLVRLLVAPQHMNSRGRPKAGALTDAERGGLSLFRDDQVADEEIRAAATGLVERARRGQGDKANKAGVFGVLRISGREIRACRRPGEEACYCLYDTAQPDVWGHAEAFQRVARTPLEVCEDRRRILFEALQSSFIPVGEFRNGLLLDLAPRV